MANPVEIHFERAQSDSDSMENRDWVSLSGDLSKLFSDPNLQNETVYFPERQYRSPVNETVIKRSALNN